MNDPADAERAPSWGWILDNHSYDVRSSDDSPLVLEVVDALGSTAARLNLKHWQFETAQGTWRAAVGRGLVGWRLTLSSVTGVELGASGGPTLTGFNSYWIRLGSGQRLGMAMSPLTLTWNVRSRRRTVIDVDRGPKRWTLRTRDTGLTQSDLAVLIVLVLVLEWTNDVDNRAEPKTGVVS